MLAKHSRRMGALMVGTALGVAAPAVALAQAAGPQPAATAPSTGEIVVTAQRRAERLQDVPISVTAASGPQLEKQGINNLQDLGQVSVGVSINHLATFIEPTIRGVSSTVVTPGLGNDVGVYVDGYYEATSVAINTDLVAVKSVQILKGPQGTLFGRNTPAGAILIDTLDPSFTPTGRISIGYGSFNEWTGQGYYSGPIVADKLAFDVSVYKKVSDGYIKNVNPPGFGYYTGKVAPIDLFDVRSKLLWTPTPKLRFTLIGEYDRDSDPSNSTFTIFNHNVIGTEVPGLPYATQPWTASPSFQIGTVNSVQSLALIGQYDLGFATLKSISHYQQEDMQLIQDGDATPVNRSRNVSHYKFQFGTQEFDLNHSGPHVDWVTGVFFYKLNNDAQSQFFTKPPVNCPTLTCAGSSTVFSPAGGDAYNKAVETSYAVFADGTWRITDHIALIGGLRFSYDDKGETVETTPPVVSFHHSWTSVTPRAVIQYKFDPNTNVYFSYSEGYKSGGYVGTVPKNAQGVAGNYPLQPEHNTAYEVGFKTVHGPFRASVAAYYQDYKNMQIYLAQQVSVGGVIQNQSLALNAPGGQIYGVEFEGAWRINENWNIHGGLGWTHARYTSFPNAAAFGTCTAADVAAQANYPSTPAAPPGQPPIPSCIDSSITLPAGAPHGLPTTTSGYHLPVGASYTAAVSNDVSGLQMLRAPDWTANIGVDYTRPTSIGTFAVNGTISYSSSFPESDLTLIPGTRTYKFLQAAYYLANLQASYSPFDKGVTITAYVKNLNNAVIDNYFLGRNYGDSVIWGPPRTYGVRVDYKF